MVKLENMKGPMPEKQTLSFRVSPVLAAKFREATAAYYGKTGLAFSAALLMFLEAEPEVQGAFMKRVFDAEVNREVETIVEAALAEQRKRVEARRRTGKRA